MNIEQMDSEYQAITGLPTMLTHDWAFTFHAALKAKGMLISLGSYSGAVRHYFGERAQELFNLIIETKVESVESVAGRPTQAEIERAKANGSIP